MYCKLNICTFLIYTNNVLTTEGTDFVPDERKYPGRYKMIVPQYSGPSGPPVIRL